MIERRRYVSEYNYFDQIQAVYDRISYRYPGAVEGEGPSNSSNRIEASDFFVRGDGGHRNLALSYGLELPSDFLEFAEMFSTYAMVGRKGIEILGASSVERITEALRDSEDIPLGDPYRIYRFARIFEEPSHFMFRWNCDGTFRDVAFARYMDSFQCDLLGSESELFSCDKSFSGWLERMIITDAAPLHPMLSDELDFLNHRA